MLVNLLVYLISFVGIWVGAGLSLGAVEKLSKSWRVSSFAVSFLILGFFTSASELSVGINSVLGNDPEIFVGNLIGATIVIFMLVVPLLAIVGKQIAIRKEFRGNNLLMSLAVIASPVLLTIDGIINRTDSLFAIGLFVILAASIQKEKGLLEKIRDKSFLGKRGGWREILKVILGLAMIFVASKFVVEQTVYFSQIFNISPFLIGLLLISVGTNIPELSFVFRSLFMKNNDAAFGDYVGSAAFNTLFFGVLSLWYGKPIYLTNSYVVSLAYLLVGLVMFYIFAKSKNTISRLEGLALLVVYVAFLLTEVGLH